MTPDPYADIEWGWEKIDWSDPELTADEVTSLLIGKCGYWDDPYFTDRGMSPIEIEREIIFDMGTHSRANVSPWGKHGWEHFLTLMKLMIPTTDITPTIYDATMLYCMNLQYGKKLLNLIGCQNCLDPNQRVRMFDGSTKATKDVVVGDLLMGPDSTSRNVTSICSGKAPMVKVTPKVGKPFYCTENHKLTVVCKRGRKNNGGKTWSSKATPGQIYDIEAKTMLDEWGASRFDCFGLLSAGVEYPEADLEVDPYVYGLWLGDGSKKSVRVTVEGGEKPIMDALNDYWFGEGYVPHYYRKEGTNVFTVALTTPEGQPNPFKRFIEKSVSDTKFIRPEYLTASREQRLQLLAGIIDTDGHNAGTYLSVCSSDPALMDGYEELANSLGFRTSRHQRSTGYFYKKSGEEAVTETLSICGDVWEIPVRLERKKVKQPKPGKGVRKHGVTGFTLERVGGGDYAGFEVGGDHRFLLDDYTITHNSSKSASSVRIAITELLIDPDYTVFYIANPFDNAADSTVWGEIEEVWDAIKEAHGKEEFDGNPWFFPDAKLYAQRRLEVIRDVPKAARIELRNVKHVGKYKGTKSRKDKHNRVRGVLGMLIDECNEIDNYAFLKMLTNITSQDNFAAITSQNFKDPEDMGGRLTEPVPTFGGAANFDELDVEKDIFWHSMLNGVTLRFDGLKAANIIAGRVIYTYLFKQKNLDLLKDNYGENSPEWFSQCRSFPLRDSEMNTVLTRAKLSSSRHDDPLFTIRYVKKSVAFCDPSFGGRDKAIYGVAKVVEAVTVDASGVQQIEELLVFPNQMGKLNLDRDAIYNEEWIGRVRALGLDTGPFERGSRVSYEDQIAIQCAEKNREEDVPAHCFGYDFSMRPDIVSSMNRVMGFESKAFDYNLPPEGHMLRGIKQETKERCYKRVDELAFLTADLFASRQIRGGNNINAAIVQLVRTRYETKNGKYHIERKPEYKARWQNVSPDERDTLMGIAAMAIEHAGMRGNRIGVNASRDNGGDTLALLGKSKKFKRKRAKRI